MPRIIVPLCLLKILVVLSLLIPAWVGAETLRAPRAGDDIIGDVLTAFIEPGDTLYSLGKRYGVGQTEMKIANPGLHPTRPKPWSQVVIPRAYVLPDAPREGIIINLPEMRLYYFPTDRNVVLTYPVGLGRPEWVTPVSKTRVIEKIVDPEWKVPESIKEYMADKGVELPDVMPPGPDNPLGQFAMRLGLWDYLIHGTNNPRSIGLRSSSGCIRMFPEDVEELFPQVPEGTPVRIINQPYKAGWYRGEFYVEAHPEFPDQPTKHHAKSVIRKMNMHDARVNWSMTSRILRESTGYPRLIARD